MCLKDTSRKATIKMLEFDRIDIPEGIDINKTNILKEWDLVTIGILKIVVLSMNHIFVMAVMI